LDKRNSLSERPTVDVQRAVCDNLLDDALLLQVRQTPAGNRSIDLHSVDENRDGDQAVGLDILVEPVGSGLVEENGVLGLVLNCTANSSVYGSNMTFAAPIEWSKLEM